MGALKRAVATGIDTLRAGNGILRFLRHGEADTTAWRSMLNLHCRTNGLSTDVLTGVMRRLRPPVAPIKPFQSMLGRFDATAINAIAENIKRNGFHVFDSLMPESLCDEFAEASKTIEARTSRNPADRKPAARFDPTNPVGYVYDLPEAQVWRLPAAQRLIGDPIFINVAQAYCKTVPVVKDINVWWSVYMDGQADSHSAQQFHFDFDATPIWLKFFVYMTDVTDKTGPHVYVRGSHRMQQPQARELFSRGYVRISDADIARVYGAENVVELCGPKGTVIAVDTLGFHKGKALTSGCRLVAQLELSTPLFGKAVSDPITIPSALDPVLTETMKTYPWAFERYRA